jgi:serine/threonine protein kinase
VDPDKQRTFFVALQESRLLTAQQLRSVRRAAVDGASATQIVRALTRRQWLTPWQSQQINAGHTAFRFGAYTLLDFIGRGQMGVVFKARQSKTLRIVALKVMSAAAARDRRMAARFRREIRMVSRLQSPHVVSALDAGRIGDRYFLATEFLAGRNLQEWIHGKRRLPVGWVCECARQTAVGLQHIHERGLIHRDLKPSNLMVKADSLDDIPHVWILDLGLGRAVNGRDEAGDITMAGHTVGTLDYIAPEQLSNGHAADIRSDLYSLGCTVFETLTGRLPFDGSDVGEKLLSKLTTDAPRVDVFRTDVPKELAKVIARLTCRERNKRPAVPQEVAEALMPFSLASQFKSARPLDASGKGTQFLNGFAMDESMAADGSDQGQPKFRAHSRRNKALWLSQFWSHLKSHRLLSRSTLKSGRGSFWKKSKSSNATAGDS